MAESKRVSPLEGIRVLDFSHILAGPYCTRLLADLGADVVKVESRSRPDMLGALRPGENPPGRRDRPPLYLNTNRSKRSITLNLKTDAGRKVAFMLASNADVIVENFSSGVMGRLGLDYDALASANPGLIYLSLSGYGHSGPRQHWISMNMNLQAHSGLMLATGSEGDPPVAIANSWNDYIGGIHGCFAVTEALASRRRTGEGANLDISQFECSASTIGGLITACSINQRPLSRPGNRCSAHSPQGVYRCAGKDEWCAITIEDDDQWRALLGVIGGEGLLHEERFMQARGRQAAASDLDCAIEEWTSLLDSREVERRLIEAGVPAARMNRIPDVMDLDEAGAVFRPIDDPQDSERRVTGLPVSWPRLKEALRPAPAMGEHTEAVLEDWISLAAADFAEFEREGAFH
ncbi:crotonobetainyl-CoA:carnitine CoA-transferase CaiB-like acyl-CoA transferase [Altererythrobacter atlanticus]|nr:CoA transferase [Croceibacterium atlanticum]MBB5731694.1 crotonobetainyl-CoA:carnitine CoA-transferase CaiB-like acyl-CoA transferase [Croceibacterium atlanticum]